METQTNQNPEINLQALKEKEKEAFMLLKTFYNNLDIVITTNIINKN
jgi:hypothetical protein